MLENPQILQEMVHLTGARSTDLQSPESAEHLCAKCEAYASEWKTCADSLWDKTVIKPKKYQNYKQEHTAEQIRHA